MSQARVARPPKWAVLFALAVGLAAGTAIGACVRAKPPCEPGRCPADQIEELWMQIRDWRVHAGMGTEPSQQTMVQIRGMSARTVRKNAMCPTQPKSDTCDDVCDLADAICDNADSICSLADEIPDDSWARDKCTSAKASCREAKERCCACNDPNEDGRED